MPCLITTRIEGLQDAAAMLQAKGYVYGEHFAPHDIKAKEIGMGKRRLETAKKFGLSFEVVQMLPVDDEIEAGKLMFARLYVDEEKCAPWLDAISQSPPIVLREA